MRGKTWPVFFVGLALLLLLILLPGALTLRRTDSILSEIRHIQNRFQRNEQRLDDISSRITLVSINVREFLLDSSTTNGHSYQLETEADRTAIMDRLDAMARDLRPEDAGPYERLRSELRLYWDALLPVFTWTPEEKRAKATYFLREQQRPRRQDLLDITAEISRLNRSNFERQYDALQSSLTDFRRDSERLSMFAALAGLAVAIFTILRVAQLERKDTAQRQATEAAERNMRILSNRLMFAQEEERRHLSRELHDEVGQMLTGLRMELGALERAQTDKRRFLDHLQEAKQLAESTMRTVREIARGLRPSALDDLGLGAALQYLGREFARRTGQNVKIVLETDGDELADSHRTCLYRVVQEALTNSAKHSRAQNVVVTLRGTGDHINLLIEDDGVGMRAQEQTGGLGLRGMEERVRELDGTLSIASREGGGTALRIALPYRKEVHSA